MERGEDLGEFYRSLIGQKKNPPTQSGVRSPQLQFKTFVFRLSYGITAEGPSKRPQHLFQHPFDFGERC